MCCFSVVRFEFNLIFKEFLTCPIIICHRYAICKIYSTLYNCRGSNYMTGGGEGFPQTVQWEWAGGDKTKR